MQTNKKTNKKFIRKNNEKNAEKNVVKTVKAPKEFESLIIIDKQYDFDNPEGALYVPGGEKTNNVIINYAVKNCNRINQIIFTEDWHTSKDKSFKTNGGTWPNHCEQDSEGAKINQELYNELAKLKIPMVIFKKGTVADHEEYGAFERCATFHHLHPNDTPQVKHCYFTNYEGTSGCRIINDNIVVCGIAGDFCVKESIKNLLKHWNFKVKVLMNGIASIDGGTALTEFINEKGLKQI